jgi:DNA/RNA-binding domain of Phe-tRNA-synthetase-like protein
VNEDSEPGWVDAELQAEFPELGLRQLEVAGRIARSPRPVRERLRTLSNRFRGVHAITLRGEAIPAAYRIFFRHIGLDPDTDRTPVEAAALERLLAGGFTSRNLLDDALLIALVETGVPVWALDAATVDGPLGIRPARAGERLGRQPDAPPVVPGRLVVADAATPLAILFGESAPGHCVGPRSRSIALFTVRVAGVPEIHIEEALWLSASVLESI